MASQRKIINLVLPNIRSTSQALGKLMEPWVGRRMEAEPKVKLKVIDMETGKVRVCPLDEAKTWDWNNPEMMRMVSGFHITS